MTENRHTLTPFVEKSETVTEQHPGEVIYQIYPSSFADGNGDGNGDLKGITAKMDYIKSLGVDAIWMSPFYTSPPGPEGDGGYAVTDYRAIDPRFGTIDEFKEMLDAAHARGIRVYTDYVIAHTADNHEWFEKSRRREEPYADYYVWSDGWRGDNGEKYPPNNWKSVFGGLAWEWDDVRQQYYLHHFLKSQPSLNLNLEKVQDAALGEMKFWLDMGVDGFRIDALPFANYDDQLRHNPWQDGRWPRETEGWYDQYFAHSICQPQTVDFVARIRELMDSYDVKRTTLGEAVCGPHGGGGSIPVAASYVDADRGLDMCYTDVLTSIHYYPSQNDLKSRLSYLLDTFPASGGHCNSVDNHDTPRSGTRMLKDIPDDQKPAAARQLMQLFVCLPGSFSMYQGQELGLTQARVPEDIAVHEQKDPTAFTLGSGRDGCRTPMPWAAHEKNAGFSASDTPYLPIPQCHLDKTVSHQEEQPDSFLAFTRHILDWRKNQPALICGETKIIDHDGPVLAFVRRSQDQTLLCLFNMSGQAQTFKPGDYLDIHTLNDLKIPQDQVIRMPAYGADFHGATPVASVSLKNEPATYQRPPDHKLR